MVTRLILGVGVLVICLGVLGCGMKANYYKGQTQLEENWGKSFESARYNQILNPDARKNLESVEGFDGEAAMKLMDKYRKAESAKKDTPEFGILTIKQ